MSMYQIAHLRKQGQDMIIVPLESTFGRQTNADQERTVLYPLRCAASAGLAGMAVPVRVLVVGVWHSVLLALGIPSSALSIFKRSRQTSTRL